MSPADSGGSLQILKLKRVHRGLAEVDLLFLMSRYRDEIPKQQTILRPWIEDPLTTTIAQLNISLFFF